MAQAAASSVTRDMETAMHRLSTGKRINAAADDAAGVAISSRLDSTVRGLNQSIRNALDAQALIDTAEGGMQETESILQRIRELSIQASNDTNSADDRANLNAEAQSLLSEIDRISNSTTWAGQSLLDGTFTDKSFQVGGGTMASDQLVTSISGASSGHLGLRGSFGGTVTTSIQYGVEDNFATSNGAELSNISTGLQTYLTNTFPSTSTVNFDDNTTNKVRAASFDLSSISGNITGAVLKLRAIPLDDNRGEGNDTIYLSGFDASGNNVMPAYNIGLGHDVTPNNYFNFDWQIDGRPAHPSEGYEITIDLSNFAAQEGINLSLLEQIKTHKVLDFILSDDTMVDYVSLDITTSPNAADSITTPQKVGSEFQVNTYTSGNQTSTYIPAQSVAALTNGDFVVTWDSNGQDGSGKGVYAQRFSADGTPKGSEFHVSSFTPNDQVHPTVTALSDGGFVVTYMSYGQDGRSNNLTDSYAQKYDSSGNKVGAEFLVHSYTNSFQHHPIVTSLDGGKFLVTWQSNGQDGSEYGIYGQMFDQSNSKIGSEFLVNTTTSGRQHHADVTKLENGSFVITWVDTTQQSSTDGIFGQRYDSTGTKIGSEFEINTHTTSDQNEPAVASLADGGFVVTWQSDGQDGDNNGIFGQRYDSSGAKVGSEFQINTQTAGSQEYSTVIGLSDGGFLTAWSSSSNHPDGSGYGIYGQRYDSSGNTVGDEFQINTYVSGDQDRISLEQLTNGNVVASWTSDGQDGDGNGIFAQIFDVGSTNVDLTNALNSKSTITLVDAALQRLNSQRASLGAISNRLDHIVANNTNAATNVSKSLGRIQDADFAAESTSLAKNQILLQASTAMLAQANASKQNILDLLQN